MCLAGCGKDTAGSPEISTQEIQQNNVSDAIIGWYTIFKTFWGDEKLKILIIEDDKNLCNMIKQQLTKESYIVDACMWKGFTR